MLPLEPELLSLNILTTMGIQYPFRSSKSRFTKQQEQQQTINQQIINHIIMLTEEKDGESIWLEMKAIGFNISHSSFNNRLKKLAEAGLIEKISSGYNKYMYRAKN